MTDIIFTVEQLGSDTEVKIEQESRFFNKR
jgi:hypothetical protein